MGLTRQDRSGVRTAQDLERKYNLAGIQKAVKQSVEGINKTNTTLENFINTTVEEFEKLQSQFDGSITTYYYGGAPTLSNFPANEWLEEDYSKHEGDQYYDKNTGFSYRFILENGQYNWHKDETGDLSEVLAIANAAIDTADSKRRVFVITPIPPYDEGDLWLNNEELYVCSVAKASGTFAAADFKLATKYTDDEALNTFIDETYSEDIKDINDQIDKKSETWYQATDPSSAWTSANKATHVGDLWYNTSDEKSYIYTDSFTWKEIEGVPDSLYDQVDGKAQVFTSEPNPPYHVNDLYVQGEEGDILVCAIERLEGSYNAADWKKAGKYTDDTNLNKFVEVTYPKDLLALETKIDNKITTWYYEGIPTLSNLPASEWTEEEYATHIGDLYYDKSTGRSYIFQMQGWEEVKDSDISEALAKANAASDTADSKRRVFLEQPTPPYDNGDLWLNNQEIYVCQISKGSSETYADKDFIIATKYTDDTLAKQVGDNLEIVRGTVTTIQEGVDAFKIDIETHVKTIDSLQQETLETMERMSYTFGTNDLTIANSNDPVNTRINQQGLKVYTYNELQSIFNHRGTGVQKLIVTGDSQLANISIVKAIDENGNDCTDINHLVSNIQTLADLEGGS